MPRVKVSARGLPRDTNVTRVLSLLYNAKGILHLVTPIEVGGGKNINFVFTPLKIWGYMF